MRWFVVWFGDLDFVVDELVCVGVDCVDLYYFVGFWCVDYYVVVEIDVDVVFFVYDDEVVGVSVGWRDLCVIWFLVWCWVWKCYVELGIYELGEFGVVEVCGGCVFEDVWNVLVLFCYCDDLVEVEVWIWWIGEVLVYVWVGVFDCG